jgi:hypothetical protein
MCRGILFRLISSVTPRVGKVEKQWCGRGLPAKINPSAMLTTHQLPQGSGALYVCVHIIRIIIIVNTSLTWRPQLQQRFRHQFKALGFNPDLDCHEDFVLLPSERKADYRISRWRGEDKKNMNIKVFGRSHVTVHFTD